MAGDTFRRIVLKMSVSGRERAIRQNIIPPEHRHANMVCQSVICGSTVPKFGGKFQIAEFFNMIGPFLPLGKVSQCCGRSLHCGRSPWLLMLFNIHGLM